MGDGERGGGGGEGEEERERSKGEYFEEIFRWETFEEEEEREHG